MSFYISKSNNLDMANNLIEVIIYRISDVMTIYAKVSNCCRYEM